MRPILHPILSIGFLLAFIACSKEERSTDPESGTGVTGSLFLSTGKPASGAKVRVFPVDWNPRTDAENSVGKVFSATADAGGRYDLGAVQPGLYNIVAESDGLAALQDSMPVGSSTTALPSDTLDATGSVAGFIALQPNHVKSSAIIELLGSRHYANVDEGGRFRFTGLPAGRYNARISSTISEYTPLFASFTVQPEDDRTLADTLRPAYTGIPVVLGLKVSYDTLNGTARVSWNAARYSNLSEYAVFRDSANYLELSKQPRGRTRDTSFLDTLFPAGARDSLIAKVEYRVKAISRSDLIGQNHGYIPLEAPSPAFVRTFMDMAFSADTVSPGDSIKAMVQYRNRTRLNDSLQWQLGSATLRETAIQGRQGSDTLILAAPAIPGRHAIKLRMKDHGGAWWEQERVLSVLEDAPLVQVGRDSAVSTGDQVSLRGTAAQRFGIVVKWEWKIGDGGFQTVSGPDTVIALPETPDSAYLCVLRATDDDGKVGTATRRLAVLPSRHMPSTLGKARVGMSVVASGGMVYMVGGYEPGVQPRQYKRPMEAFDTLNKTWSRPSDLPIPRTEAGVIAKDGKIYVVGGIEYDTRLPMTAFQIYDIQTNRWSYPWSMNVGRKAPGLAFLGGKLYAVGGYDRGVEVYDPAIGQWERKKSQFGSFDIGFQVAAVDTLLYILCTDDPLEGFFIYDPARDTFRRAADVPLDRKCAFSSTADGRLVAFGGVSDPRAVYEYLIPENRWVRRFSTLNATNTPLVAVEGSDFYIFDGQTSPSGSGEVLESSSWERYRLP